MQLEPESKLQNGKYKIIRTLGQGGFGITYEAEQVALHRRVAIKEFFMKDYCDRDLTTSHITLGATAGSKELVEKFRTKFIREAQMIAALDNPHIIKIFDVFEENGTAYYVMPFLDRGSLADLIHKYGPLSEQKAIEYVKQVGGALEYLHKKNILHLDIKPSNILLNSEGEAVLIDFGISKHYDEAGSQTSTSPIGISKGFAPIEQHQQGSVSQFSPATDIYSLGATLYYLLTGKTPPEAVELLDKGIPSFNGTPGVQRTINEAMSPRRGDRPQSIASFLSQLSSSSSPINNPRPAPVPKDETTKIVNKPPKTSIQNYSSHDTPPASKVKDGGHSAGIIAAVIGSIAIIVLVFVLAPSIGSGGRANHALTNITTSTNHSATTASSSVVKLPNKCHFSGNIVMSGKSIPVKFDVDFTNRTGNSYYSSSPLSLTVTEISEDANCAEFLLTERNPNRTSIPNNTLGGNITATYRCSLNKNGTVSGTGMNYKGQDFTFTLTSN